MNTRASATTGVRTAHCFIEHTCRRGGVNPNLLKLMATKLSTTSVKLNLIRCPGCECIVDVADPACSACGRCLNCGDKRIQPIVECASCSVPLCECCQRCVGCGESPSIQLAPCDCGHPNNKTELSNLLKHHAISARKPPTDKPISSVLLIILVFVLVTLIAVAIAT